MRCKEAVEKVKGVFDKCKNTNTHTQAGRQAFLPGHRHRHRPTERRRPRVFASRQQQRLSGRSHGEHRGAEDQAGVQRSSQKRRGALSNICFLSCHFVLNSSSRVKVSGPLKKNKLSGSRSECQVRPLRSGAGGRVSRKHRGCGSSGQTSRPGLLLFRFFLKQTDYFTKKSNKKAD